jgi:hypothetical protein
LDKNKDGGTCSQSFPSPDFRGYVLFEAGGKVSDFYLFQASQYYSSGFFWVTLILSFLAAPAALRKLKKWGIA